MERDPKKHPRAGDILRRFGCTRYVTAVAAKANGTILSVSFASGSYDGQRSNLRIASWRSWAASDCEVLLRNDVGDDPVAPRMFIAQHHCGGLVASSWADDGYEEENQKHCDTWRSRGYQVALISVKNGSPMMPWCECNRGEQGEVQ